jgi:predicted RND superfamily exporter protein
MQMTRLGRFVFVAQWFAAVLLPLFVVLGRGLVGADLGWMAVIGIIYGAFVILLLLVPPLVTLFDREVRAARAERSAFAITSIVLWAAIVVTGLSIPDSGDSGHLDSALMTWTGMSYEVSTSIFAIASAVVGVAYLIAFILAIVGIVRGSSARADAALQPGG